METKAMSKNTTQEERLDYLVEGFKADSDEYKELQTPNSTEDKRRILRSLMNIRMPKELSSDVMKVQDEYLTERAAEKGVVNLSDIPVIRDGLSIWQGDITRLSVDAIVNAANSQMLGCFVPMHTCIDNCIHTFAGVQLRAECNRQMNELRIRYGRDYEQPTAVPMLTEAYNLPAKKVIHIVGPIVQYKLTPELEKDLENCYRNTLDMCAENSLKSVAFCCISTGVFHFPNKKAAEIAVETVSEWLSDNPGKVERVIFNVFKDEDKPMYRDLLKMVSDKDYFVITTNVDHQFQRAGFDKKRLFYTQGDYGLFQSVNPAIQKTFDNEEWVMKAMEAQGFVRDDQGVFQVPIDGKLLMEIPSELIPKCPDDGSDMTMNLRADDSFVEDEGWHKASAAYSDFIRRHENLHVLYLELGVGANTPVIIKYPFWQMTLSNENAVYACLNYGESYCPEEIADRSICIDGDIGEVFETQIS